MQNPIIQMKSIKQLIDEHVVIHTVNRALKNLVYEKSPGRTQENGHIEDCILFLCHYVNFYHKVKEEKLLKEISCKFSEFKEDDNIIQNELDHDDIIQSLEYLRDACFEWRIDPGQEKINSFIECLNRYINISERHMSSEQNHLFKKVQTIATDELDKYIFNQFIDIEENIIGMEIKSLANKLFYEICVECL